MFSASQIVDPPIGHLNEYRFYPMGDTEVAESSYAQVQSGATFNSEKTPKPGGIMDAHLGTIDYAYVCDTCENPRTDDLGHPGYAQLNVDTLSPIMINAAVIIAKKVCHSCFRLVKSESKTSTTGKACQHCAAIQPSVTLNKPPVSMSFKYKDQAPVIKYPSDLRVIFESITDETARALGYKWHPRVCIQRNIPITPPPTRPDVKKIGGSARSSNDRTTVFYHFILENNMKIPKVIPQTVSPELQKQYDAIMLFYYNCVLGPSKSEDTSANSRDDPNSTILRSLGGKTGNIRGNLLGKPTFYMMRSVITGNPRIKVYELCIPQLFAQSVELCETVQEYNYAGVMQQFANSRTGEYPRVVRLQKRDTGKIYYTNKMPAHMRPEIGDKIWRNLRDGDIVIFNRQPSLYYASMNMHIIKVIPGTKVFSMSELACAPYNADFSVCPTAA